MSNKYIKTIDVTPVGITNYRNEHRRFGIRDLDRMAHIYSIGKTGVGKSTLLLNMILSDIQRGHGTALIDPHGDLAETILNYIPEHRLEDVVYFNPGDIDFPIGINPMVGVHPDHRHLVVSGLISTFKKIWFESWGPRLEHILRYTLLALLEYPGATLLDIQPFLSNSEYRSKILKYVKSDPVISFFNAEFDKYTPSFRNEAIAPILNKMGVFNSSMPLRNSLGQKTRTFRLQHILDSRKILICNLSKGHLGDDVSAILGSIMVTSIQLCAMARARVPEHLRKPFFLYIDEAHLFVNHSFAEILSEARKYKLSLFLTHQYLDQLDDDTRSAVFGNVGTIICFRVGSKDAELIEPEFFPVFNREDIINLPKYGMYVKLMIDGATSMPFSADSVPNLHMPHNLKNAIIERNHRIFARKRMDVEREIRFGFLE